MLQRWRADDLHPDALGINASRRTDIPALMPSWFGSRLEAGFAEYVPAGPPRLLRRSLLPSDVTHFNFWSKWPRPLFPVLDRVIAIGYPVLFNITITGLGGGDVEPNVPATEKAVAATLELAKRLPAGAIQWRYDPVFVSQRYGLAHHLRTFRRLCDRLAGVVDRVATSFVEPYGRRVRPDLDRYHRAFRDLSPELTIDGKAELLERLREIAESVELPLTVCCQPQLAERLGCAPSGCNQWAWAQRVYPVLARHRKLRNGPTRAGCACSREVDIGVYDTCTLGCRYCYASRDLAAAKRNFERHQPQAGCLLPPAGS